MIFTLPVVLYQLLFVSILFLAGRLGRTALNVALVACLIWTATHLFLPLLMLVQATVICLSYLFFKRQMRIRDHATPVEQLTQQG